MSDKTLDVLADHIGFDVDRSADFFKADGGPFGRVGDDADVKGRGVTAIDGQAGTVNGNRAFFDHVSGQGLIYADGDDDGVRQGFSRMDRTDSVHMAGDKMAVKSVREPQRSFQIDPLPNFDLSQYGTLHGFGGDIDAEPPSFENHDRQAGTIYGDAVPDAGSREIEIRGHCYPATLAGWVHSGNGP